MQEPSNQNLKVLELQQKAAIKRAEMAIDFAKFGFRGTLSAAFGGMVLVLALAAFEAWTPFKLGPWGFVGISFILLIGCLIFGYLSLWSLPKVAARLMKMELFLSPGEQSKENTETSS